MKAEEESKLGPQAFIPFLLVRGVVSCLLSYHVFLLGCVIFWHLPIPCIAKGCLIVANYPILTRIWLVLGKVHAPQDCMLLGWVMHCMSSAFSSSFSKGVTGWNKMWRGLQLLAPGLDYFVLQQCAPQLWLLENCNVHKCSCFVLLNSASSALYIDWRASLLRMDLHISIIQAAIWCEWRMMFHYHFTTIV